ncbi:uncharacterized protein LOC109704724 [Ananas comosus]|uniref:Uncharacterized protein LOC109704724 n=1 Tax=Ananas comosus TaxID=4615 RepID=A0A6P5ECH9_ANACO|nr:uncharacterized protein LOC109704724 [Ananas comosus]
MARQASDDSGRPVRVGLAHTRRGGPVPRGRPRTWERRGGAGQGTRCGGTGSSHVLNCVRRRVPADYFAGGDLVYKKTRVAPRLPPPRTSPRLLRRLRLLETPAAARGGGEGARSRPLRPRRVALRGHRRRLPHVAPRDPLRRRAPPRQGARAAADPNLGFAAQLRGAQPAPRRQLPGSARRVLRLAPHSPAPRSTSSPNRARLLLLLRRLRREPPRPPRRVPVHVPAAVYVGSARCEPAHGAAAARLRPGGALRAVAGPVVTVAEVRRSPRFLERHPPPSPRSRPPPSREARVELYDLDFEILPSRAQVPE